MFESQKGLINKNMNTIKERMFLDKENPVYEYSDTAEKLLRPSVDLKFEMEGTLLPLVERAN
jgi:hypothetical protein